MAEIEEKPRKRTGRPPKAPEKGRRQNYTFRMSDETRDKVVESAAISGRSMSEELEWRVEHSFDLGGAISLMSINTSVLLQRVSIACAIIENWRDANGEKKGSTDWKNHEPTAAAIKSALRHLANDMCPTPTSIGLLASAASGGDPANIEAIRQMEAVAQHVAKLITGQLELPRSPLGFSRE